MKRIKVISLVIRERVKTGGHSVPEATIRKRYTVGLKNFFNLYCPLADSWQFYDNSNTNNFSLIASEVKQHSLIVKDEAVWNQLLEISNERR